MNSSQYGVYIDPSSNNETIFNNTLRESALYDLFVDVNSDLDCNHTIENNTGSGNRPIIYANGSVSWSNLNASELFLCNADGASFTNILVNGSDSIFNNAVWLIRSDGASLTNVNSSNNRYGYYLELSNNNAISNGSAWGASTGYGFYLLNSNGSAFVNNTGNGSSYGFYLQTSHGNNFTDSLAITPSSYGVSLTSSNRNLFRNSMFSNAYYGFYLISSHNNTMLDSAFRTNNGYGITLSGSHNNTMGNVSINNSYAAFYIVGSSNSNTVANSNAVNSSQYGIYLSTSPNNTITNNSLRSSSYSAAYIYNSNNSRLVQNHYSANTRGVVVETTSGIYISVSLEQEIFDSPSGDFSNYTNLSLNDTLLPGTSYQINWSSQPAPAPVNLTSLNGTFVNITNLTVNVSLDSIAWRWTDSQTDAHNESNFSIFKYNSSGWTLLNGTPDTATNTLSLYNVTPLSIFGILFTPVPNVSAIKLDQTAIQPSPGGRVQFNITVNNTGDVDLSSVLVTDTLPQGLTFLSASPANTSGSGNNVTWTFPAIAPGASQLIYLNATVDAGAVNSSVPVLNLTNDVNATGTDTGGNNVSSRSLANVTVYYANVSILKLDQTAVQPSPGGVVQFNITATNTGNVTLNVTVLDMLPAGLTFYSASPAASVSGQNASWNLSLGPGASSLLYLNATVDSGTVNSSVPVLNLTNMANATGTPPNGDNVTASSSANVTVYYANLSVLKLDQTAAQPSPGGVVQFNLTVNNTGNVTLNITLLDILPSGLTFASASPSASVSGQNVSWNFLLDPGISSLLYLNASVDSGAVNASSPVRNLTNVVNATGVPPNGANVTASSSANATIYYANITVLKLDQTAAQPSPGGIVRFNISVNNTGNVTLNVSILDNLPAGLLFQSAAPANSSAGPAWDISLPPGSFATILLNATVEPGAVNASVPVRNLTNLINATGTPPNGANVTASSAANVTVYYANVSVLKLDQTALQPSPGGTVQFNLTLNNTGNVTLNVTMLDTLPSGLAFASASPPASVSGQNVSWSVSLPPGASALMYLNATVNPGAVNASLPVRNLTNVVNATGSPPNGDDVTAGSSANVTVYYANLSVLKLSQTAAQPSQGGLVQFNLTITNTGNVTLSPVSVADSMPAGLTFSSASPAPDSISGQNASWSSVGSLPPGSSVFIYLNATVDAGTVNSSIPVRNLTNYANATGTPPNGDDVTAEDFENATVYYANISVLKLSQTAAQPSPGGIVQFNMTVTNTGNVTLNVTALDALPPGLTFLSASPANASAGPSWTLLLGPGASSIIFLNATVDAGVVNASTPLLDLTNQINATGVPPNGDNVTASSSANVTVYYANVSVLKLGQTAAQPSPGGLVQFNLTITNTGNVSLNPIELTDDLPAGLTYASAYPAPDSVLGQSIDWDNIGPLTPGASSVIYLNATVDAGAVNASVPVRNLTNYVEAAGVPPNGDNVTADDFANVSIYYANVTVIKVDMTPLPASPGGLVQWQINVSNPGEVVLDPVFVSDTLPQGFQHSASSPPASSISADNRTINWSNAGPIAPGGSVLVLLNSSVGAVANGTYTNNVTVLGSPLNGDDVGAADSASVGIFAPAINLVKTVNQSNASIGQNVTFSLNITNTGSANLTVSVTDVLPQNVTFEGADVPPTSVIGQTVTWSGFTILAPGASAIINYNVTTNAGGSYENNATATGSPLNGDNVSDSDSAFFTTLMSQPPQPEEEGEPEPGLSVGFQPSCDGNIVTVDPPEGHVSVKDVQTADLIASGDTDDGEFEFQGCGMTVDIKATKSGYTQETITEVLLSCEECAQPEAPACTGNSQCAVTEQCVEEECVPVECGACQAVVNHACENLCASDEQCVENVCKKPEQPGCSSDLQCEDTEFCNKPPGLETGNCKPVQPGACGGVKNHAFVPYGYECGAEPGCPSCPEGSNCTSHECVKAPAPQDLSCPTTGIVGDEKTCAATENGQPCAGCDYEVTDPDGRRLRGRTDENGNVVFPIEAEGTYKVSLLKGGQVIKTLEVKAFPQSEPEPPEKPGAQPDGLLVLSLLALLIILLAVLIMRRKKGK
ncbi:MAG: NosD domain-containing protein [Candidatus Micrarchaeota archaeon]